MGGWQDPREVKHHLTTLAGVVIPALQALISGLALGVIFGALAYIAGADHFLAVGLLSAGLGGGIAWLISLSWWRSRVYRSTPPKLPGVMGSGEVLRLAVTVDSDVDSSFGGVWLDLPVDREKLIKVSERLLRGGGYTYANLAGRHKILTRAEFDALRSEFIARGLLRWKSPHSHTVGVEVTRAGAAAFRRLAEMATPSPPRSPRARYSLGNQATVKGVHVYKPPETEEETDPLDDLWR